MLDFRVCYKWTKTAVMRTLGDLVGHARFQSNL
jgi:hypothetical protein